jgi:hypothetical protein
VALQHQQQTFSGVIAHFQNGVIEWAIGSLTSYTHAMLTHAMCNWPEVVTKEFWPFALLHAANILNFTPPKGEKKSNYENFTGQKPPLELSDFHVFGFCSCKSDLSFALILISISITIQLF